MQPQCAAATEARKRTGSTEIDPTRSKKPCHLWKQLDDQRCGDDRFVIYIYFFFLYIFKLFGPHEKEEQHLKK